MKSQDRIEREREKRSMMWGLIGLGFVLIALCALLILGFSGDNTSVGNFLDVIIYNLKDVWENIWFKISNFLNFLKRGI